MLAFYLQGSWVEISQEVKEEHAKMSPTPLFSNEVVPPILPSQESSFRFPASVRPTARGGGEKRKRPFLPDKALPYPTPSRLPPPSDRFTHLRALLCPAASPVPEPQTANVSSPGTLEPLSSPLPQPSAPRTPTPYCRAAFGTLLAEKRVHRTEAAASPEGPLKESTAPQRRRRIEGGGPATSVSDWQGGAQRGACVLREVEGLVEARAVTCRSLGWERCREGRVAQGGHVTGSSVAGRLLRWGWRRAQQWGFLSCKCARCGVFFFGLPTVNTRICNVPLIPMGLLESKCA